MIATGKVVDYTTEQPLDGASVVVLTETNQPTGRGKVADASGMFDVAAEPNEWLKVTHVGYSPQVVRPSKSLTVYMTKQGDTLGQVVVTAKAISQEMKTVRVMLRVLIVFILILLLSKLFKL